jgi:uncharacterized protein (TIGR02246 family)
MLNRVRLSAVVIAACVLTAPAVRAQSNEGGMAQDRVEEKKIRESFGVMTKAWNSHDTVAMGALWAIDGDHHEPDGAVAKGRDAVTVLFKRQHEAVFKHSKLDLSIADVWFVSETVALVDGGYEVSGARLPDGTPIPSRRGHLTAVLLRERDKWNIVASRLMVPTELPYKQ